MLVGSWTHEAGKMIPHRSASRSRAPRVLLLVLAFGARAQDATETLFSADTKLVVLHATVTDSKGRLVTNLARKSFTVLEDNVEQPIKTFLREDVPVSLALVVDNSGSM